MAGTSISTFLLIKYALHQVPADLFVIGDGDCGQFGLGEDVVEAPRPLPTIPGGQQVRLLHGFNMGRC